MLSEQQVIDMFNCGRQVICFVGTQQTLLSKKVWSC